MHIPTATLLGLAGLASAHTTMFAVWVNGADQGDGRKTYIRSPPNNNPVKDLTKPDVACNVNGGTPVSDFVKAAAGDTLTFEWFHDKRGDDIIAASHKGPIMTYIADYTESDGSDVGWTKIAEDGLDGDKWAVDKLIAAKGKWDFKLPASLKAGKYLVRQEVIGLHEADVAYTANPKRGAQLYPSCVQVEVTGSGSTTPNQNFMFKTGYTEETPGIVFDIYKKNGGDNNGSTNNLAAAAGAYPLPGPTLWDEAAPGDGGNATSTKTFHIKGRAVRL